MLAHELAFAAVYRERDVLCGLLWGVGPHDIPTESSGVAACKSMGLPHLIVALVAPSLGAPGCPGRSCGREGDVIGVSFACKATKERRVSAVAFGGREGEVKGGLSKPWCKRGLTGTPRSGRSNSGSLRLKVLLGLCNHWPFLGEGCRSGPSWNRFEGAAAGAGCWFGGRADPSRVGAGAVPGLVKGTAS